MEPVIDEGADPLGIVGARLSAIVPPHELHTKSARSMPSASISATIIGRGSPTWGR